MNRLREAKISRKNAEEEAEKISNRIHRIKQKQVDSERKIEIMREMSAKVKKIREEKLSQTAEFEQIKAKKTEQINKMRQDIKMRTESSFFNRENIVRSILNDRKNEAIKYREKLKKDEELFCQLADNNAEINSLRKTEIFLHKDQVLRQREAEIIERKRRVRENYERDLIRERNLVERKLSEKMLMEEVDLGMIEMLQDNKIFN